MSVKAEQDAIKKNMRSPQSVGQQSQRFCQTIPANGSFGGTLDRDTDDTISMYSNVRINRDSVASIDRPIRSEQPSYIARNCNMLNKVISDYFYNVCNRKTRSFVRFQN